MKRIEDRISTWRNQYPGHEDDDEVILICDAEDEIGKLRKALGSEHYPCNKTHCRICALCPQP